MQKNTNQKGQNPFNKGKQSMNVHNSPRGQDYAEMNDHQKTVSDRQMRSMSPHKDKNSGMYSS